MFANVARPWSIAATIVAKSSSSSTRSAASRATSVPDRPIATPMSANAVFAFVEEYGADRAGPPAGPASCANARCVRIVWGRYRRAARARWRWTRETNRISTSRTMLPHMIARLTSTAGCQVTSPSRMT